MTNQPTLTDEIILDHLDELCHRFAGQPALVERLQGLTRIIRQRLKGDISCLIGSVREHEPSPGDRLVPNPHQEATVLRAENERLRSGIGLLLAEVDALRTGLYAATKAEDVLRESGHSMTMHAGKITVERDALQNQVDTLTAERDALQAEIKSRSGNGIASSW